MKIVVTGSLGNISKPLTQQLLKKGHAVTVISSSESRQKEIEAMGATAAIGSMEDAAFLTKAFTGADAVYTMITAGPNAFFNKNFDLFAQTRQVAENYVHAIRQSGVKRVVHLSSIGAHTDQGNGILAFHHIVENIINQLPADVSISFMRPVGFYYNLLSFIPTIKAQGVIASNYGEDDKDPWVSPVDIATAVAEELELTEPTSRKIRYVASEEITCNEVAAILGTAIGKPDLKWIIIPDEQLLQGMLGIGMNAAIAKGLVEMNASRRTDLLYEDYYKHRPVLGNTKIKDYAKEFAAAYSNYNK